MILPAQEIRRRCGHSVKPVSRPPLIEPFHERTVAHGMTFGLSSCGYDVRIANALTMPPGECELAVTVERFHMPNDLMGMVFCKSSWARQFLNVGQGTALIPGWFGNLTIELYNASQDVIYIPAGAPIAQIMFVELSAATDQPYTGKYQNQGAEPQPAIVETTVAALLGDLRFVLNDDRQDIYRANKRIGYVTNENAVFIIGRDGWATQIGDVDHISDVEALLREHVG